MTGYTPELADEVLVMGTPYRTGVGTVTDERTEADGTLRYFVEGTQPDGETFSRWYPASDLTPARWGTWYVAVRAGGVTYVSHNYKDEPIPPLELILDQTEAKYFIIDPDPGFEDYSSACPPRRAIATAHIETVEVVTVDRRETR